ncbi:KH domain-containing protein [Vitiosangium sp. GDMCC 1.1324]|uniref:KH domain-containing protein n=1 Tax=Vitiosangium sp. (strain GDMCC 1.1324) TaxID=2138576 RepID=UPI000D3A52A2|nr:KH domain-containing protein [Vitiosangium sp. GDMCC 1.1324]PTL80796.1 RNA-binding protein [Vitiosangium sp. GDMCC 1.1324]
MEQLIIYLARALVDQPDQVSLRASDVEGARLYELKVAPEDVGKVIGRDGRTVGALRTLLGAAAQKQGQKVRLEIQDDRRQHPQAAAPTPANAPQGQ